MTPDPSPGAAAPAPIAMLGLGRMGANMSRRLARAGLAVHGFDASADARAALAGEAGVATHETLAGAIAALRAPAGADRNDRADRGDPGARGTRDDGPRVAWLMLPAGEITDATLAALWPLMRAGDVVVDGGNANYLDSRRRAGDAAARGIGFVDCGVSGGVWGLANGYCLSMGGRDADVACLAPYARALAPSPDAGWLHCGASGAGHFVKMIHNGIEYGMMQSIAEGFALLEGRQELNLDLAAVAGLWQHGSVIRSWLLELTASALATPGALGSVAPYVAESGEGRWTVDEAVRQGTPAPVIALALMSRFDSQGRADVGNRLLALMRQAFGGHAVRSEG